MNTIAIIVAAGKGIRMGGPVPKQYRILGNRPVICHSLTAFDACDRIDRLVWVVPETDEEWCRRHVLPQAGIEKPIILVPGGPERQDSVYRGLMAADCGPDDLVAIHDGVRPLIRPEQIRACIRQAEIHGACLLGIPVTDTLKQVGPDGRVGATLDRRWVWAAQTPQVFRYTLIRQAHENARRNSITSTDDSALVEALGQPVVLYPGDKRNLKITTPEDLAAAEALLRFTETDPLQKPLDRSHNGGKPDENR